MISTSLLALSIISLPKSSSVSSWDRIMIIMVIILVTGDYSDYAQDDQTKRIKFRMWYLLMMFAMIWMQLDTSTKSFRRSIVSSLLETSLFCNVTMFEIRIVSQWQRKRSPPPSSYFAEPADSPRPGCCSSTLFSARAGSSNVILKMVQI